MLRIIMETEKTMQQIHDEFVASWGNLHEEAMAEKKRIVEKLKSHE